MTFDEACGVKNPHGISHDQKYAAYLEHVGYEEVKKYLPSGIGDLKKAYRKDRNFNTIPLSRWEKAAGYPGAPDRQGSQPPKAAGPFPRLLMSKGITIFSSSECVCLLKYAAEQAVLDQLCDPGSMSFWAVFERWNARPDKANRNNIFDYDCVALFDDEQDAIRFELENPGNRVRKLIRGQHAPKNAKE